jgi:hypothetical protein
VRQAGIPPATNSPSPPTPPPHPTCTPRQIIRSIDGDGKYASIEAVQPSYFTVNPLMPVDYHNDFGVNAIPTTEDVSSDWCFGRGVGVGWGWVGGRAGAGGPPRRRRGQRHRRPGT